MKGWLALLACLVTGAQAAEVAATGYGKSVDEALANARVAAVSQVAGTFVTGQSTLEDGTYRSRTDAYNGGYIRKHEILSVDEDNGLFAVRIRADVDTDKVNTVIVSDGADIATPLTDQIDKSRDEYEKTGQIVAALDDPAQAFAVKVGKVSYRNRGELTDILAEVSITYSPKWYDDVRLMAQTIGRKVDIGSKWSEALWGIAALSALVSPALPGTLFSIARHAQSTPKPSKEYMVCFSKDAGRDVDECYEIRHPFGKTTQDNLVWLGGRLALGDEDIRLKETHVGAAEQLYLHVWNGKRTYFSRSSTERTFHNPGIVLFKAGAATIDYEITIPTEKLRQAGRLEFTVLEAPPALAVGSRKQWMYR